MASEHESKSGSAAGQRLEEWLSGVTDVLQDLPQVNNSTSVHLSNLRAAYFNAKPPNIALSGAETKL